jgi:hypothetical protein
MKTSAWTHTSTVLITLAAIAMAHTAFGAVQATAMTTARVAELASIEDARIEAELARVGRTLEEMRPALEEAFRPSRALGSIPTDMLSLGSPAPVGN